MYLAGIYFGGILYALFIMFLVIPALSLIVFIIWIAGVSCEQFFDSQNPVKGDRVHLTVRLCNDAPLPVTHAKVRFDEVSSNLHVDLQDGTTYLPANGERESVYQIRCPYRGTYTIGVREIVITDIFHFLSAHKSVEKAEITVYPRILELNRFAPVAQDIEGGGRYASAGLLPDPTLFHELKEYRDGDSIRHIYWRKYAGTGRPVLKKFEHTKRSGVRIYVDVRASKRWETDNLIQEDAAVEALVALVRYLLLRRIYTTVLAATPKPFVFTGVDGGDFDGFYRNTAALHFEGERSPKVLYETDRLAGVLTAQTPIFITHEADPSIFDLTDTPEGYDALYIFNKAGQSGRRAEELDAFAARMQKKRRRVIVISDGERIAAELGESIYAY